MTDAWDGRPQNPKRTGAHWIKDRALNHTVCVVWCPVLEQWHDMAQTMEPRGAAKFWRYLGPCALPDEVATLRADNTRLVAALAETHAEAARLREALREAVIYLESRGPIHAAENARAALAEPAP